MQLNKMKTFGIVLAVLTWAVSGTTFGNGRTESRLHQNYAPDTTIVVRLDDTEVKIRHRMSTTMFPIQMTVIRRAIKIKSDHSQMLPIYHQNGAFYMAMRLNKGVNWLTGLPRGRYFINNKPISIN